MLHILVIIFRYNVYLLYVKKNTVYYPTFTIHYWMIEVPTPPAASALMESTRSIGYSFESALADIIDNSISASAENVWITSPPSDDPYVTILDDGYGLSASELQEAMRYGTCPSVSRDSNDLGRFGLGMKMASLSQCRALTVISKQNGEYAACRWDLDKVIETNQWTLLVLSYAEVADMPQIDALNELNHGTLVVWQKLDKIIERAIDVQEMMNHILVSCRDHLSLVFHRFMDSKSDPLSIYVNGAKLVPFDPFLSDNTLTAKMPEQIVEIQGEKVRIKPYILPPESKLTSEDIHRMGGMQRTLQGFWVYRNKRLIIPGTWFRLTRSKELTKLARVMVDIPNTLDSIWDIDVKKSSATVPAQFQQEFGSVLEKVITKSERKYRYRGRKESVGDKCYVWNKIRFDGAFRYNLNIEHPLITEGMDKLDEEGRRWFLDVVRLIETSVPYSDIYCTMADAQLNANDDSEDLDHFVNDGIRLLEAGLTIDVLRNIEPFLGRKNVIARLEEYNGSKLD